MLKHLPDVIVKELIDFEKNKYSEIRDKVMTLVHNYMNTSSPMELDKHHVMAVEGEDKKVGGL
jgi:hypothetical protein